MELYSVIVLLICCTALNYITTSSATKAEKTTPTSQTTPSTTTSTKKLPTDDTLRESDKELNIKLQHIIETSKIGYTIGNMEYDYFLNYLRIVSYLEENLIHIKYYVYYKFKSYNELRLKLEGELDQRIAVVKNYLIHDDLNEVCKDFYLQQKMKLIAARNENNALKIYILMLHSEDCVEENSELGESYYINYNFWPIFF